VNVAGVDDSEMGLAGLEFVVFLLVLIWPVQAAIALALRKDANEHGMAGTRWMTAAGIPGIGLAVPFTYLFMRRQISPARLDMSVPPTVETP
jgi:hypothetical protein